MTQGTHGIDSQCRGLDAWEWIRGQEIDQWEASPKEVQWPADGRKLGSPDFILRKHLRGTAGWRTEEDPFVARSNTLMHHTRIRAECAIVTEDGWCLHYAGKHDQVVRGATMFVSKPANPGAARALIEPALFHLPDDPKGSKDILHSNQRLAAEIRARYLRWLEQVGCPEEPLVGRRKLV